MELIVLFVLMAILALLGLAALRIGVDSRPNQTENRPGNPLGFRTR